jgi:4-hydroxy-3-polyprenylbenzoate decarboxylase
LSATNNIIAVGITGASGAVYTIRLLETLLVAGREVHLSISPSGASVIEHELGRKVDLANFRAGDLFSGGTSASIAERAESIRYFHYKDFMAPMASGSARIGGMVVCPCSGGTLSAIAYSASGNLIHRAADVQLKERRKLILVTREMPLSLPQIDAMRRATEAGAIVLPASPGFYHHPQSIDDLVNFVVARICDHLDVEHQLSERWGEEPQGE